MPAAIALNGNELLEAVQSGVSSRINIDQIGAFIQSRFPLVNLAITAVATLADLRGLTSRPLVVLNEGYATPGDNGGGVWYWDGSDTTTADNTGTVVQCVNANDGRYKRLYEGPLMIEWFGAVEGATVTSELQACLDYAVSTGEAVTNFPGSTFDVDDAVTVGGGTVQLLWDQKNALFRQNGKFKGLFLFPGYSRISNYRWLYTTTRAWDIASFTRGLVTTTLVTTAPYGFTTGASLYFNGFTAPTLFNNTTATATVVNATTFTIPLNTAGFALTDCKDNGSGLVRVVSSAALTSIATDDSIKVYDVLGTTEANGQWLATKLASVAVSNAVNNGSGAIRLTVASSSTQTGDPVTVAGVTGTTEANGNWIATRINATTIDLQGSTFANVYISGGALTAPNVVDLQGTTFANAYISGGYVTEYIDYAGGGHVSDRPTIGGQGFSAWQTITGAWVTGDYVELHNGTAENFYSLMCLRGPVVPDAAGPNGYDFRSQAVGFKATDLRAISCDFLFTGTSMSGAYVRGGRMTTPTNNTVPPHMVYTQSPAATPEFIIGAANNGSGAIRITTSSTQSYTTGLSVTLEDVGGTVEANGTWLITRISSTEFDLQGSTFVNAYTSGGIAYVTMDGFIDGAQIYDLKLEDFTYSDALKFSNMRYSTLEGIHLTNCTAGGITLGYATGNKIIAPTIIGVADTSYGIRQTDVLGSDNQIIGGTISGAVDAQYYAVFAAGGARLTAIGVTAVSDFAVSTSSTVRTFYNGSAGGMICRSCTDIQLQDNNAYSYGNATNAGELLIDNPIQRGRQGLLRTGSGSTTRLMVTPAFVDSWDAGDTACINNAGTLSLTSTASLDGSVFTGLVSLKNVAETYSAPAITSGTLTINLALGTVFNVANNANITTFTISNTPAGKATAFTLILTADGTGYAQTWGASVVWPLGAAPTLTTTNGKRDVLTFITNDAGTTWFGSVSGQNY